MNVPDKPTSLRFIRDPHALTVAVTRARLGLFYFGSDEAWV